jgi:hypothetical protein
MIHVSRRRFDLIHPLTTVMLYARSHLRELAFVPSVLFALGACGNRATSQENATTAIAQSLAAATLPPSADAGAAPARLFVAQNADADTNLHLLARAFVNNDTEVMSFYEPQPGIIVTVASGRPDGHTQLAPRAMQSATNIWNAVAPGQDVPTALLDAMKRKADGVGNAQLTFVPEDAGPSTASLFGPPPSALAPTPKVLGTGYCDNRWTSDFNPQFLMGCFTETQPNEVPLGCNSRSSNPPLYDAPFGSTAYPFGAGCSCSGRTVQGFRFMDEFNVQWQVSYSNNNWENFVSACPSLDYVYITVNSSNWNHTWFVNEDNYLWVEETGGVTCVVGFCTGTSDPAQFNVSAQSFGALNYLAEAYGP